jgi:Yip1 domain
MEDQMTFGERVVGALKLEESAFEDVERDPTAIGQAVGVIVLGAVSMGIGWLFYGGISGIFSGAIASLIGSAFGALLIWVIGTKLMPGPATKADFPETFRTLGFAAAPTLAGVITIIPLLGWPLYFGIVLWQIAATVVAVKAVLDYTDIGKAIIVVLVAFAIVVCLWFFMMIMTGLRLMLIG